MFSLIWPGVLVVAIIFGVLASFVAIATFGLKKRKRDEGK
jgi:type II secretory pathway pseudopilin PulG